MIDLQALTSVEFAKRFHLAVLKNPSPLRERDTEA